MITVDNKFEVGEKAYTGYRVPITYKCPICEGDGKFEHNGYEVQCKKCNGLGKLPDAHNMLLAPAEVTVSSVKMSYGGEHTIIKYKLRSNKNISNRSESMMFKTIDEAENYCKCVNTKEIVPEY